MMEVVFCSQPSTRLPKPFCCMFIVRPCYWQVGHSAMVLRSHVAETMKNTSLGFH